MLFLSAAAAIIVRCTQRRRIEFVYGECHVSKNTAGIVIFAYNALLVRDAILCYIDKVLRGTLNAHDREESKCHVQVLVITVAKIAAEACAYVFGNAVARAYAARRKFTTRRINYLGIQYNRLCNLNGCDRHIGGEGRGIVIVAAEVIVYTAAIDADAALAAVQDYFLFYDGNSLKLLSAAHVDASLKDETDIEADSDLIESAVKLYGFYIDAGTKYVCTFCSDVICAVDDFLTKLGKIYPNILKAIFIAARVKNSVSIDTNGFFAAGNTRQTTACAGTSVLSHIKFLLK